MKAKIPDGATIIDLSNQLNDGQYAILVISAATDAPVIEFQHAGDPNWYVLPDGVFVGQAWFYSSSTGSGNIGSGSPGSWSDDGALQVQFSTFTTSLRVRFDNPQDNLCVTFLPLAMPEF